MKKRIYLFSWKKSPQITPADYNNAWLSRTIPMNHPRGFEGCRCKFHTDHRVLKARILKWFAITFSSGAHSIGTLHHDPPILGGPIGHGLVSLSFGSGLNVIRLTKVFCDYGFSVSALWCPLATPTILLGFLLPWMWGISSVMTNLDSILKSRDITLPTKVRLVKAMVFPVVMYGCESWTIKKAERQRFDAFELWCWRRLLRVPWIARSSN